MADCALPALTEKVQEALEDTEALEDIPVLWGPPTGDDKPRELIVIGSDKEAMSGSASRDWGPLGGGILDEDLEIPIAVEVTATSGTDLKPAFERSFAIAADVEAALRRDPGFGDFLLKPASFSALRGRYFRSESARGHHVFLTLTGTARI